MKPYNITDALDAELIAAAKRIVMPNAGPLIYLAHGNALDLLLAVSNDVCIVVTDVVELEVLHRLDRYPDARAIRAFLQEHSDRIEVLPTTIGRLAISDLKRRSLAAEQVSLSKDLGELSITNFVISLRTANPGDAMLVIVEDDWFMANSFAVPSNVHLVSTSAWLDGLQAIGCIESAAAVRRAAQMGQARR